jgi:hypothetical protein
MGHYHKRPEKGACDAMSLTYSHTLEPCCHKARYVIGGKRLCRRHAFIIALELAIERKDAIEIPGVKPESGLVFVDDRKGGGE